MVAVNFQILKIVRWCFNYIVIDIVESFLVAYEGYL